MDKTSSKIICRNKGIRSYANTVKPARQKISLEEVSLNNWIRSDYTKIKEGKERDIKWMKLWAKIDLLIVGIIPFAFIVLILWGFKGTEKISPFIWPISIPFVLLLRFFLNHFKNLMIEIRYAQKELRSFEEKTVAIYCSLLKKKKNDFPKLLEIFLKTVRIENDVGENRGVGQDDGENTENTLLDAIFKFLKK
jgi:hypothetical protein